AELVAEAVHALRKATDELRLARPEDLGDGLHPPLHLALGADEFGELRLEHRPALGPGERAPPGDQEQDDEQHHGERRDRDPRLAGAARPPADLEGAVHAPALPRFERELEQNTNELSSPRILLRSSPASGAAAAAHRRRGPSPPSA